MVLYQVRRILMMCRGDYSEEEDIEYREQLAVKRKQHERDRHNRWSRNSERKAFEAKRRYELYPKIRLSQSVAASIRRSLKHNRGSSMWENFLPYTLEDLVVHFENLFQPGMNWSNYGKWHIDHKRPISSFDFSNWFDPEFQECWALNNLQPLWALDNILKGAKWDG